MDTRVNVYYVQQLLQHYSFPPISSILTSHTSHRYMLHILLHNRFLWFQTILSYCSQMPNNLCFWNNPFNTNCNPTVKSTFSFFSWIFSEIQSSRTIHFISLTMAMLFWCSIISSSYPIIKHTPELTLSYFS